MIFRTRMKIAGPVARPALLFFGKCEFEVHSMSGEHWFSTKLRFVIMVGPMGGDTLNDSIFLLRAQDFDTAFTKSLNLGRNSEKDFRNAEGFRVQWRFMEIVTLDMILSDNLEGQEIYSEPIQLKDGEAVSPETQFAPQKSKPLQTI